MQPDTRTIECPCGTVFEPQDEVVDRDGERWVICPKCKKRLQMAAIADD